MAAAQTSSQIEIGRLKATNDELQQENDRLRQELLAAKVTLRSTEPRSTPSVSSTHSGPTDKEEADRPDRGCWRIRGEMDAMKKTE